MAFSATALSIMTQQHDHTDTKCCGVWCHIFYCCTECHYAECRSAECLVTTLKPIYEKNLRHIW